MQDTIVHEISIGNFTNRREDIKKANLILAEKLGMSVSDIKKWIRDRGLVWHHADDGILQLVPGELHRQTGHTGFYGR